MDMTCCGQWMSSAAGLMIPPSLRSRAMTTAFLLIYQDNRPSDMTAVEIVKALANVIAVHPNGISERMVILNQYRW